MIMKHYKLYYAFRTNDDEIIDSNNDENKLDKYMCFDNKIANYNELYDALTLLKIKRTRINKLNLIEEFDKRLKDKLDINTLKIHLHPLQNEYYIYCNDSSGKCRQLYISNKELISKFTEEYINEENWIRIEECSDDINRNYAQEIKLVYQLLNDNCYLKYQEHNCIVLTYKHLELLWEILIKNYLEMKKNNFKDEARFNLHKKIAHFVIRILYSQYYGMPENYHLLIKVEDDDK